jgi:hypothetical protein
MGILLTFMFVWNMLGALIPDPRTVALPAADLRPQEARRGETVA